MYLSTRYNKRKTGSILIAVLAIIFLSTVMLYQFVEEAVQELQYRGQQSDDPELRSTAYSALELSLGVLHEFRTLDGKLVAPVQGWGNPLEYANWSPPSGYTLEISIFDESAKIPLSSLDEEFLPVFFEEMELDFRDSELLTEMLLDWQDEDDLPRLNGAEVDSYSQLEPPYRPANRRLQSWEELAKIEGFRTLFFEESGQPNELYDQFTSSVSLFNQDKININTANRLVLEYIGRIEGFDPRFLDDYLRGRDGIRGTDDDQILFREENDNYTPPESGAPALAQTQATLLRLDVLCSRGDAELLLSALVSTRVGSGSEEDGKIPFTIQRLSENLKIR